MLSRENGLGLTPGEAHDYTILIVDDDADLLHLMERSLRAKYRVLTAQSASVALELLRANPVQLLVTDQYMPGMSGVELLALAKAEKPEVGRLLVTGRSDLQDLIAAVNLGQVQYYLTKPWNLDALLRAVDEVVEKHRLKDENRRLREIEAALRKSEARFRLIAEHSADVIWTVDPATGRFTYVSPGVQRLRGYTPEEMMQTQDMQTALTPESYEKVMASFGRRLAALSAGDETARVAVTEIDQPRRDGSIVSTEVVTTLVPDAQGRVVEIVGISRDITERRQAEAELRKSEERYRFLIDHLPAGLLIQAPDGRVVLSNPKAAELLGLSRLAPPGAPAAEATWQFVREDTSEMPVDEYPAQRVFATGAPVSYQVVGLPVRDDYRWMLASAFPDFDAQGQVRQAVVMLTDISRRKEAEAALAASEGRYRELYRSAQRQAQEMALLDEVRTVVAGELDLATVMRKVVEAIADTFGYPLVSLYLRQGEMMVLQYQVGYAEVLPAIPVSKGILGRVMRTGQPVLLADVHSDPDFLEAMPGISSEACVPLFDGARAVGALNVETRGIPFAEADLRLLGALGEQIGLALGRARLYTQVREDAATKATLLHEVNHRVKNNLSAIIGLLQLEQDYISVPELGPHQALIGDVVGRIQSLAAVHDLLSEVQWAPLPIHDLADRIIRAAIAVAAPHSDLSVEIPRSSVQVTSKQASALALIINELATNSLKHALPKTSPLCLRLQIRQEAQGIRLEYGDNGPGFPPEVLAEGRHNVGLHLIRLLSTHDLRGKMELSNNPGATVRISFWASAGKPPATGPFGLPWAPGSST